MKKKINNGGRRLIKEQRIFLGFLQFLAQRTAEEMEQKEVKTTMHFCCHWNGLRPLSRHTSCQVKKRKIKREEDML
jgi:hypothetical protein